MEEIIEQYKNISNNPNLSREEKIADLSQRSILLVSILKQKHPNIDVDYFFSSKVKEVLPEVFEVAQRYNMNINDEQFIYIIPDSGYKEVIDITFFSVWDSLIKELNNK